MAEVKPYHGQPGYALFGAAREAEVIRELAAIRAEARRRVPEWEPRMRDEANGRLPLTAKRWAAPEPGWCTECGYKVTSAGHLNECGMPP